MEGRIKCPKCGKFCRVSLRIRVKRKGKRYLRRKAHCEKCGTDFYKDRIMRKGKSGR